MRCSKVKKLISSYIDDEISQKERELIELHARKCGSCAAAIEEIRKVHDLFVQAERFSAPYGFSTKVMANVTERNDGKFSWILLSAKLAEMVVLLMIVGMGTIAGTYLASSFSQTKGGNLVSSLPLDIFNATPPDSLGGAYLAMTEGRDEKR